MNSTTAQSTGPRARIRGQVTGRIRKLSGFQKHHHVPDNVSDSTREFVRRIGQEDVKATADGLYNDIRETFRYKRKEFHYSCDEGVAIIKTPDYEVEIRADQNEEEPKLYQITTELTALHNLELAADPAFHTCFNAHCEELIVEFPKAIQLEEKIDALEEIDALAEQLSYEPDCSSFELKLPELDLHIQVDAWSMHFRLLTLRNLGKLIDHSQRAFEILTDCDFDLRLVS